MPRILVPREVGPSTANNYAGTAYRVGDPEFRWAEWWVVDGVGGIITFDAATFESDFKMISGYAEGYRLATSFMFDRSDDDDAVDSACVEHALSRDQMTPPNRRAT